MKRIFVNLMAIATIAIIFAMTSIYAQSNDTHVARGFNAFIIFFAKFYFFLQNQK